MILNRQGERRFRPFFLSLAIKGQDSGMLCWQKYHFVNTIIWKEGKQQEKQSFHPKKQHSGNSEGAADLPYQGRILTNFTEAILIRQEMKNSSFQAGWKNSGLI